MTAKTIPLTILTVALTAYSAVTLGDTSFYLGVLALAFTPSAVMLTYSWLNKDKPKMGALLPFPYKSVRAKQRSRSSQKPTG